jgi:hypothetical protein
MSEEEYLNTRLKTQIAWYSRKARLNKHLSLWTRIIIIALGVSIGVVTQIDFDSYPKSITLTLIGAVISLFTGIGAIMRFQEKWTKYRSAAEALKHEEFIFKTRTGPYSAVETPLQLFVPKIESLISNENDAWREYMNHKT